MIGRGGIPPKHVYSILLKNKAQVEAKVFVEYVMPDGSTEKSEMAAAPGQTVKIPQRTQQSGQVTNTGRIARVSVSAGGRKAELREPFNVTSPTKDFPITFTNDGTLQQGL
jgi:hypothetical protein